MSGKKIQRLAVAPTGQGPSTAKQNMPKTLVARGANNQASASNLGREHNGGKSYSNMVGSQPFKEGISIFVLPATADRLIIDGGTLDPVDRKTYLTVMSSILYGRQKLPSSFTNQFIAQLSRTMCDFNKDYRHKMLSWLGDFVNSSAFVDCVTNHFMEHADMRSMKTDQFSGISFHEKAKLMYMIKQAAEGESAPTYDELVTILTADESKFEGLVISKEIMAAWYREILELALQDVKQYFILTSKLVTKLNKLKKSDKQQNTGEIRRLQNEISDNICALQKFTNDAIDVVYAMTTRVNQCHECGFMSQVFLGSLIEDAMNNVIIDSVEGTSPNHKNICGVTKYWFDVCRLGNRQSLSAILKQEKLIERFAMSHPRDIASNILRGVSQSEGLMHIMNGHNCIQYDTNNVEKLKRYIMHRSDMLASQGAGTIIINRQSPHSRFYAGKGTTTAILTMQMPILSCSQVILDKTLTIDVPLSTNVPMASARVVDTVTGDHVDSVMVTRTLANALNDVFLTMEIGDLLVAMPTQNGLAVHLEIRDEFKTTTDPKKNERKRLVGKSFMNMLQNIATKGKQILDTILGYILAMISTETGIMGKISVYLHFTVRSNTIMCAPIHDDMSTRRAKQRQVTVQEGEYEPDNDDVKNVFDRITSQKVESDESKDIFI